EPTIEIGEAEEGLDVFKVPGRWPVLDNLNFLRIHANALRCDDKAEVLHLLHVEFALFNVHKQANTRFTIDEHIIEVSCCEFIQKGLKSLIDEGLKSPRPITNPEWHHRGFEKAVPSTEGCEELRLDIHPDAIECCYHIKLREPLRST
ncbi:hypothetical protein K402DRAFT_440443, partial [Aulographum hederae CBS 113979]